MDTSAPQPMHIQRQPQRVKFLSCADLERSDGAQLVGRFQGRTAVILASGPSLDREQANAVLRARKSGAQLLVITVNNTWQLAPWADIHYSNDVDWWQLYLSDVGLGSRGLRVCGHPGHMLPGVLHIPYDRFAEGIRSGHHPRAITWGRNSGAAAWSLADLCGCTRILLVGFDQCGTHWHDDHPPEIQKAADFAHWRDRFYTMAIDAERRGIKIVNCSRRTALTCIPRAHLGVELAKC